MDNVDMVWISACYPIEFEQNLEGIWIWKYVGNARGRTIHILVSRTISYVELYNKVKQELKIDLRLHKMEMACIVPMMAKAPIAPIVIDCDNNVKWFMSVCRETVLCITLSEEAPGNREWIDVDTCLSRVGCEKQVENMNKEGDLVQNDNVVIDDNDCGILLDWNDFHLIQDSPQRPTAQCLGAMDDAGLLAIEPSSSTVANDNNADLSEPEPRTRNLADDNTDDHTNEGYMQAVVSSFPSVQCGSSVRIPKDEDIEEKQLFPTKKALIEKLQWLDLKCHFEFKVKKSNKSIYTVVCVEENYKWQLRATKMKNSNIFEVRKYQGFHNCSMSVHHKDHRHASYMVIGKHIVPKYQDSNRIYRPRDIINDVRREFGITISYTKAYMAKDYAGALIRGNPRESFAKLPSCCHMLELQNPGTRTFIHTTRDQHFKYFFMALGPSIRGFLTSIRRVIFVDGTFLTSNRKGTLLLATCQDSNYQIYPLAWGIVDSENNKLWTWFFRKLHTITGDTDDHVIISDRAISIKHGFEKVFELAHHGYCIYHIQKNLKSRFPHCDLAHLFMTIAEAYTVLELENYLVALLSKNEGIKDYLLKEEYRYWSRAQFDGIRYNVITTNNAETLNGLLKSVRDFPIIGLIDHIRETQQRWFYERHVKAGKCTTLFTPDLEKKMCMKYNESNGLDVNPISPNIYDVGNNLGRHIVDLDAQRCTCKKFDLDKFPCEHAIAVVRYKGGDGYSICSPFYTPFYTTTCWQQAYSEFVYPLPNEVEWKILEYVMSRNVLPPLRRKQSGQPPKNRKRLAGETHNPRKCSKCKKTSHNRSTCTSLGPADQQ